jgi:shikimate dehydrogenase
MRLKMNREGNELSSTFMLIASAHHQRVGLIGADIGPSLSPALHEREARELGLSLTYERIDITKLGMPPERIGELLRMARCLGLRGVNVTHPCKQSVLEHLDDVSDAAAELGAVNTVVFTSTGAVGYNTDWPGFERSFSRGLPDVPLNHVVLLGAGGAGSAAAHAALSLGVQRLVIRDRQTDQAQHLVTALARRYGADRVGVCERLSVECRRADGLIHATPTGMAEHPGMPLDPGLIREDLWVAEVVYRPLETELLRHARRLGCRTLDGGGMAVIQAALSFELFTRRTPDLDRMLRHFATISDGEPDVVTARGRR